MGLLEGKNGITVGNPGDGARTPQPPTFRLSRELEAEVLAEARRIGIETGSKPRPLDLIRVLISEALAARARAVTVKSGIPLPCPFCGDPDGMVSPPEITTSRWVYCPGCGAEGPLSATVGMAIGAWNDREPLTVKGGAR